MLSEIPLFHFTSQLIFCFFALLLLIFDIILILTTLSHRKDANFPFSYMIVMSVCGIFCKFAFITDFVTYLVLPYSVYLEYRELLGREITLLGTLTYFIPMFVSVLMTLNRLFIVVRPTDQRVFNRHKIFLYCLGILVICLALLLIPYFSNCSVNFSAATLEFVTACAPDKHPMTRFTTTNAIWIPTTLLLINLSLVLHLKAVRHSVYARVLQKSSVGSTSGGTSRQLAQCQKRREQVLMRQTVAITVYLSFYEVGSFLMRNFPEAYNSFSEEWRAGYFYFRLETICAINFFVYFLESNTMRKNIKDFVNCEKRIGSGSKKSSGVEIGTKVSTIYLQSRS